MRKQLTQGCTHKYNNNNKIVDMKRIVAWPDTEYPASYETNIRISVCQISGPFKDYNKNNFLFLRIF